VAPLVPASVSDRVVREVAAVSTRVRNGIRHLADVPMGPRAATPRQAVWRRDKVVLYRYDSDERSRRTPILLVMSLITRPTVFDLHPGSSLVEDLLAGGFDVFLLDWGVPDEVEAANTVETYTDDYLPLAIRQVTAVAGADGVTVFGYCFGAVLSLLAVAGNPDLPVRNLVALATPIDFGELATTANLMGEGHLEARDLIDETGNVPARTVLDGVALITPTGAVAAAANLWQSLADDRRAAAHQAFVAWATEHVPFPGAAFEQFVDLFLRRGLLVTGEVPLGGRTVELARISCPVLNVVGERDTLVPPASTEPLPATLSGATVATIRLPAGHAGLFVGRQARTQCVPAVVDWLAESDRG
jgi:polyhydroxyalkanoate synthase